MTGKIPRAFVDQLLMRVDLVEVIDRRVPLTRKGKEYQARCPFHEEKTPSFTVSPVKQFYHCFGCGEHGTAIGFLMQYANLSFPEAVEELAATVGLQVPSTAGRQVRQPPGESSTELLEIVTHADRWFQQQLRTHAEAKQAIAYLKKRGLDANITAEFGIGYAPSGWNNLGKALGTNQTRRQQLQTAGLLTQHEKPGASSNLYDRFRGRIMFPIEDHRGRVVAFGGRAVGDGNPKYLNSPETPLFHKGAELYRLHRARREIGRAQHSIVVEGYLDVVSLAQFGIGNAVATMGTATTRAHVQRLFRLAEKIVFCFDGDRAGRAAAWKAMQVVLPEIHDGRHISFLFLPEGEDPDSVVRAEQQHGFMQRIQEAVPLSDFLVNNLLAQVDMKRTEGRAQLVALAKPLLAQFPTGALQEMMFSKFSSLSGLSTQQLRKNSPETTTVDARQTRPRNRTGLGRKQISPLALAISLLLQSPSLANSVAQPEALQKLTIRGAEILLRMLEKSRAESHMTTARLLELFREEPVYDYLAKLAIRPHLIEQEALAAQFNDTLKHLLAQQDKQHRQLLTEQERRAKGVDKPALRKQVKESLDERKPA